MDAAARVTSKGQVTVPKVVRDALGISRATKSCSGSRAIVRFWPVPMTFCR
jgi:bifunctional DNA-binding transcriptional regulator/antitoxin component of YhaV-PrlF toxin-antitoxin module